MIKPILRFYKRCKSAFNHGIAFKRMELGRYHSAAQILESECRNNPDATNIEYSYYAIGQCYYRIGRKDEALSWLSKSYDRFKERIQLNNTSPGYLRAYRDMLQLYWKVLRINDQEGLADKILNERGFGG